MKILTHLLTLILLITSTAYAQPKIYIKSSDGMFSKLSIVKENKEIEFVEMSSNSELIEIFEDNEISYIHIKDYDSYSTKFHASLWGGLGLALIYLFSSRDNYSAGTYWAIFGTGLVTSFHFGGKARHSFYKAVNTYNGVNEKLSFKAQATTAPKLSYTWNF